MGRGRKPGRYRRMGRRRRTRGGRRGARGERRWWKRPPDWSVTAAPARCAGVAVLPVDRVAVGVLQLQGCVSQVLSAPENVHVLSQRALWLIFVNVHEATRKAVGRVGVAAGRPGEARAAAGVDRGGRRRGCRRGGRRRRRRWGRRTERGGRWRRLLRRWTRARSQRWPRRFRRRRRRSRWRWRRRGRWGRRRGRGWQDFARSVARLRGRFVAVFKHVRLRAGTDI